MVPWLSANAALNTKSGEIKISRDLVERYPHLKAGTYAEELFHFEQVYKRGWFRRALTPEEQNILETEVVKLMLDAGFEIFIP